MIHAPGPVSRPRAPSARRPTGARPLRRLPALDGARRWTRPRRSATCPGLALLESARPGRTGRWSYLTADPVAVLEAPAEGADPFAEARRAAARLDPRPPSSRPMAAVRGRARRVPRLRPRATVRAAAVDRARGPAPAGHAARAARLGVAWDRRRVRRGSAARAVDGDGRRLARRLGDVLARVTRPPPAPRRPAPAPVEAGPVGVPIRASTAPAYEAGVEAVRAAIGRGDIYQANLTRRLEAPFAGDPWPLFRRLRTGDPALFAAYLDLGPSPATGAPRALLSASPEPFLSVDARRAS